MLLPTRSQTMTGPWSVLCARVLDAGLDVLRLQIGIVRQDLGFGYPCSEQVEHVLDADAHSSDARASAALPGIERDPVQMTHGCTV